jgi:hypothetical protein
LADEAGSAGHEDFHQARDSFSPRKKLGQVFRGLRRKKTQDGA